MKQRSQYAALPFLAGPYNWRRSARLRAPIQQFSIVAATLAAAGMIVLAMVF
jgi:hypothetical protein